MGKKKHEGLEGQKFNRLTAIEQIDKKSRSIIYYWQCDCGNVIEVPAGVVISGNTKSCGCIAAEKIKLLNLTHGGTRTRLYKVWNSMKARCFNKNNKSYQNYGGRGITVCDEWRDDFTTFREWAYANGYAEGLSIERVDNDGGYSPDNCIWATRLVQNNNSRKSLRIEYRGKTKTFAQWQRELNFPMNTVYMRIHKLGWDIERAFETPVIKQGSKVS